MILYRYILKECILPFLYSMGIIIFIFIMTTAVQLLDRIISKGLSPAVVLEIFAVQLGWIVALAVPMSILTSTLMTFGGMSANNEILAIKSTGQNLLYLIAPVFITACLFTILNIFLNDLILPDANHRAANLLSDISRKRPGVLIEPGVLIRDFPNYALWVKKVNPQTGALTTVRIYSMVPGEDPQTIIAEAGEVKLTPDEKRFQLTLYNGEMHRASPKKPKEYFLCRFKRQVIFLQSPETELKRTNSDYRGDREMSSAMMLRQIDQYRTTKDVFLRDHEKQLGTLVARINALDSQCAPGAPGAPVPQTASVQSKEKKAPGSFAAWAGSFKSVHPLALSEAKSKLSAQGQLLSRIRSEDSQISSYMVEVHKKFSIPFACIVFVLIGAPLGIMAKRGGITVGASYSLFFFIVYWALLIWGEDSANKCKISPAVAMWSGNILIGICGCFLLWRVRRESTLPSLGPLIKALFSTGRKAAGAPPGKGL